MNFAKHSDLKGMHSFLSPSNYHWINYDPEKLDTVYRNMQAARRGTELHEYAQMAIKLGQKQPRSTKTVASYINDAIGYRMTPEQVLFAGPNAFGTTDAIGFKNRFLRVHDLKTGTVEKGSPHQLEVYVAFFCLEYEERPNDLEIECRIYQNDEINAWNPDPEEIMRIMAKVIAFDRRIELLKAEGR